MTNYVFTTIDPPGSVFTAYPNINNTGEIAGYYVLGATGLNYGYVYQISNGLYTSIDTNSYLTIASGINDLGQIIGHFDPYPWYPPTYGYIYTGTGSFTPISVPGTNFTVPVAINNSGEITGWYQVSPYTAGHGFIYNGGSYSTFDAPNAVSTVPEAINASGEIVGEYLSASDGQYHGFLYDNGVISTIDPPGSVSSVAGSINDYGAIFGQYGDSSGHYHDFIEQNGVYTSIDFPGAVDTFVERYGDINNLGQAVGAYRDSSGAEHGFIYSNGIYTSIDPPGSTFSMADGINNLGQIVGFYRDANGVLHDYLATPVIPPALVSDRSETSIGGTVSVNAAHGVLANDTDPVSDDHLQVSAVNGQSAGVGHAVSGTYGTLTLNADGSYTYSATSNPSLIPSSGVGLDAFDYTAATGQGGAASSTLTVVVVYGAAGPYVAVPSGGAASTTHGKPGVLDGSAGDAWLTAATGQSAVLIGGPGDTLTGAVSGKDTFIFSDGFGANVINNFRAFGGNHDVIQLDRSQFSDLATIIANTHQAGANTVIDDPHNSQNSITLTNLSASLLTGNPSNFSLV
jgi:probable HAF family extracellular repeat protein/VCBS repeat-containing protein